MLQILENPSNVIFYILLHINSTKSDSQICQVTHTFGSLYFYFCASALFYQDRDQTKTLRDTNFFMVVPEMNKSKWKDQGAKYLGFFSSRSLKTREKCISFAQFVYFLREVCLLFHFWMIKFAIMFFWHDYEFHHSNIVNFVIQKLKSKHTSLKIYTNWAKLINFSLILREREEKKTNISHLSPVFRSNTYGTITSHHLADLEFKNSNSNLRIQKCTIVWAQIIMFNLWVKK